MHRRCACALWVLSCGSLAACSYDWERFDGARPEQAGGLGGALGSAASASSGGAAGSGPVAGDGGSGGSSGSGGCPTGKKLCGATCLSAYDPATGCGEPTCSPCDLLNASTVICAGTGPSCQIGMCSGSFADCDGQQSDGCEQDLSKSDDHHCGSCLNDCTTQGFDGGFACSNLLCGCTTSDQCRAGSGTATCNSNRRCACSGTECNQGEACKKTGPSQVCSCNGGAACIPGLVCCKSPAGCRDLGNDSSNCGACGRACAVGESCEAGQCE